MHVLYSNKSIIYVCRLRILNDGSNVSFIDPSYADHRSIDVASERRVDDYIISVMENSKEKELILWPYHKL